MLLDGYWKKDLKSIIKQLEKWSGKRCELFHDYSEHKVNQGLLYSAVIIRKIVEDEKDGEEIYKNWMKHLDSEEIDEKPSKPKFATMSRIVSVARYAHIDGEKFFMNSKLFLSDYDAKHAEHIELPLSQMCNQLIHSYVWGIAYSSEGKKIYGIMTASDKFKEKEVYLLKIDDWIDAIRFVIDNSTI